MSKRNWERRLIGTELESGSLAELIEIEEFIDDTVFLTTDGYPGVIAELQPAAFECLDPIDRDMVAQRFQAQMRQVDSDCRVYQHYLKRVAPSIPSRGNNNPVTARVVNERMDFLDSRASEMYSDSVYLTVVQESKPMAFRDPAVVDRQIRANAHALGRSVEGMLAGLQGVEGRILGKAEAFRFLRRLLNLKPWLEDRPLVENSNLAWQLTDSSLDVGGIPRMGLDYFRVFTLRHPPERTYPHLLESILAVPANMMAFSDWKPLSAERLQQLLRTTKNHLERTKKNYRGQDDGAKVALIEELTECQGDIELRGVRFGEFCLTIVLYDQDPMALRRAAAAVESAMTSHNAALAEQTDRSALVSFLSAVPGNWRYSIRPQIISDVNYADLSFLFGPCRGAQTNPFLRDEYLTVVESRWHTPIYLNLHVGELGHTCITGVPGSGKTVLASHIISQYQKYEPNTIIFDVAHSFRYLTERFGGSYIEVGRPDGKAKIAPFCLPRNERNLNFLFDFVRLLIESDGGDGLSSEDSVALFKEIEQVYRLPKRTLGVLAAGLPKHLANRLARWVHRRHMDGENIGQFAYLFDNEVDTITFERFQTFDFPDLEENREAVEALMFYVLHQTDRIVERSERPSLTVMDEAWRFIQHEQTAAYIRNAMKAWRKRNGVMLLVLHSLYDVPEGIIGPIVESCATYIHGHNPRIDEGEWQRVFKLKECETELIRALKSAKPGDPRSISEFLLQGCGVFELRESERALWLYGNSAHTNEVKEAALSAHGLEAGLDVLVGGKR